MRHIFFAFPGGSAGIALVSFRLSAALWIAAAAWPALLAGSWPGALLLAALGLAAGVVTRIIAGAGVAGTLVVAAVAGRIPTVVEGGFILIAAGVALIGPGAYSIDAALFGRRTVHLPD